jgi:hypothetical protein
MGEIRRSGCPYIPSQVTRYSGYPSAALASSTCAGPRSTYAAPTAMTAPVTAAMAGSGPDYVLSVDVNAGEQGHQVGDLDVLE